MGLEVTIIIMLLTWWVIAYLFPFLGIDFHENFQAIVLSFSGVSILAIISIVLFPVAYEHFRREAEEYGVAEAVFDLLFWVVFVVSFILAAGAIVYSCVQIQEVLP